MAQAPNPPARYQPSAEERAAILVSLAGFGPILDALKHKVSQETFADLAIYQKAAEWALGHGDFFEKDDVAKAVDLLVKGGSRAAALAEGKRPWAEATGGTVARGYVSKVDGSIQPYAVSVPPARPDSGRYRLEVVLHGRDAKLSEVRFLDAHDDKPAADGEVGLVLHVFGRTNNAYRWAGETDVFEAIEAVKRAYPVDERRIVLRGFSMGGAGAWHLGLHHPSLWCAVEAGAGFTDTRKYIGRDAFPDHEAKALHIYDAVDYALNAFNVPITGYGGELDKQLRASVNIKDALAALGVPMKTEGLLTRAEGIDFLQVVGAKTGHSIDPESAKILKAFRDERATQGLDLEPKRIRFTTYTLKYHQAPWLSVEGLEEHYKPAVVEASLQPGDVAEVKASNVSVLAVDRDVAETLRLGDAEFPLRLAVKGLLPEVYFRHLEGDRWEVLDYDQSRALQQNVKRRKRPGLQGPIDDAFTGPFLCVRGTNPPWDPKVQAWADARLQAFAEVWDKSLRGKLRVKKDTEVAAEDIEQYHLVLFGDPGSNAVLERLLPDLPLRWSRQEVVLGDKFAADQHVPVLIAPNPRNPLRYVVINSGHTFGAEAFAGTNALLYPRLGDFAVFRLGAHEAELKVSGYFDESWTQPH
jgi:hypothetical protein